MSPLQLGFAVVLFLLWGLWACSVPLAQFMLFALDSEVSTKEGIGLGAFHATWVAGIPLALLVIGHVVANGFDAPRWKLRWLLAAGLLVVWVLIFTFWQWAAAAD